MFVKIPETRCQRVSECVNLGRVTLDSEYLFFHFLEDLASLALVETHCLNVSENTL